MFDTRLPKSLLYPPGSLPHRLAGMESFESMAPLWTETAGGRRAVVGMIFFPPVADEMASVLFLRRSRSLRSHGGQIGFVGGHADECDSGPLETLRREALEEVALSKDQLHIVGALPLRSARDGYPVFSYVAVAYCEPQALSPSSSEVEKTIFVPWDHLVEGKEEVFEYNIYGYRRTSYLYRWDTHNIWGLTAQIVYSARIEPAFCAK